MRTKINPKYALILALSVMVIASCTKNKPRRGLYWGEFYTQDTLGNSIVRYDNAIQVEDPTEQSVNINGSSLEKSGNAIKGNMGYTPAFPTAMSVFLDGKWKNKNGNYKIEGSFTAVGQSTPYYGTFKMGSY